MDRDDDNAGADRVARLLEATYAGTAAWELEAAPRLHRHATDVTLTPQASESHMHEAHRDGRTILRTGCTPMGRST